jgi:hypothetical protein
MRNPEFWFGITVSCVLIFLVGIVWANRDHDGRCAFATGFELFWGRHYVCHPTASEKFGCAHTYINARGEDTGECE